MRQSALAGQTAGLRPAERRRLDRLCHRRHPVDQIAESLCLQRLAEESHALDLPLTLAVDGRGLCRLLWVGPMDRSASILEHLPGSERRRRRDLRLLTCTTGSCHGSLQPGEQESIVALSLCPRLWLRYPRRRMKGGQWPAALFIPQASGSGAWAAVSEGDLIELCQRDPFSVPAHPAQRERTAFPEPAETGPPRERVLLLVMESGDEPQESRRIAELEGLVRSAGAESVGMVRQRRSTPSPQTLWGVGKLQEAALQARRLAVDLVVTDRELTPAQARNLERHLDLPVSDRSELILDIFAQRAASGAGRLQVELAQLRYRLPRLSGRGVNLSRQGGGIGTRGPGETQLEKDRRAIGRRIERLQRDVRQLGTHRSRLRQARRGIGRLALVGYTNAGKSSLLNALTRQGGADPVLAVDQLFATLDPTTRRLTLVPGGGGPPVERLLTDTVGFIRDLPPALVEAFRSTIEEALDADGLLVVVDLSDPAWQEQLRTVHAILDGFDSTTPRLVIGNQIDRCPASHLERARRMDPTMQFVSAVENLGLQHLRQHLLQWPSAITAVPASSAAHESFEHDVAAR